jgi:quinol monooxygenase YgiN
MIALTAIIHCKPDGAAAVEAALREVMVHALANEPGTLSYYVSRDVTDKAVLCTYERYADRSAMERHNNSEAVQRFFTIAQPLLAATPTIIVGEEIVA